MRHSLYIGALLALFGLAGVGLLGWHPAHGQAGPPGEVINQGRVLRAVTPSDSVDLTLGATRGIYNGGTLACNIALIAQDDTAAVTLAAVPAGAFLPLRAKRVMATNTTCASIVGIW